PVDGGAAVVTAGTGRNPSPLVFARSSRRFGRMPSTSKPATEDRKSTRLNSSHQIISYAVFCLKKKKRSDTKCAEAYRLPQPRAARSVFASSLRTGLASSLSLLPDAPPSPPLSPLSLPDALPISGRRRRGGGDCRHGAQPVAARFREVEQAVRANAEHEQAGDRRSEEHTSELQSPDHLVCRLLLEKKEKI